MDIDNGLRIPESRYRKALSASIGAKAHYLARLDEPNSTPASPSTHVDGSSPVAWAKSKTPRGK